MQIELPWGRNGLLSLPLPPCWRLVAQGDVTIPAPLADLQSEVCAGLDQPIGTPPLRDLVGPETRVALVMDDLSRPTPVHRLAPVVLNALLEAGAQPENVTGLFAVGTHRVMRPEEMADRAGASVVSRIACHSFDCHDAAAFVNLGRTRRGTPVTLNRIAAAADLRVLIGTIEPHPQAGFGGGFKNLLPGLAAAESIGQNHLLMPAPDRYNMIGTLPEENPMRQDIEEAGRMVDGPTLIVNVVLDPDLEPVAVVCGDAVAAHRVGVAISRRIYGVELPHQVDVVLSSAYPMDQELRQAGKGVLNVAGACRPDGVIVGFMHCERGVGNVDLPRLWLPLSLLRLLTRGLGSRGIRFLVRRLPRAVPVEARFMVNFALQMLKDYRVLLFSPHLKAVTEGRFPPVLYGDLERLLDDVVRLVGRPDPEVAVFRQGGVSFPVLTAHHTTTN